jgi:hypothetical protein
VADRAITFEHVGKVVASYFSRAKPVQISRLGGSTELLTGSPAVVRLTVCHKGSP